MYTLVFTGPSRKTARFHVTKHVADAQRPRNNRFARCTGCVHTLKPEGNPSINRRNEQKQQTVSKNAAGKRNGTVAHMTKLTHEHRVHTPDQSRAYAEQCANRAEMQLADARKRHKRDTRHRTNEAEKNHCSSFSCSTAAAISAVNSGAAATITPTSDAEMYVSAIFSIKNKA